MKFGKRLRRLVSLGLTVAVMASSVNAIYAGGETADDTETVDSVTTGAAVTALTDSGEAELEDMAFSDGVAKVAVSKVVKVNAGDKLYTDASSCVSLNITPLSGIDEGDSIVISLENGTFDSSVYEENVYKSGAGYTYEQMLQQYKNGRSLSSVLHDNLGDTGRLDLPYKAEVVSDTQLKVTLFLIDEQDCGRDVNRVANSVVSYQIPIYATAGNSNVSINVESNTYNVPDFSGYVAQVGNNELDVEYTGSDDFSISRIARVASGEAISDVYLKVIPKSGVGADESILINIENGSFDRTKYEENVYISGAGRTYEQMLDYCTSGQSIDLKLVAPVLNANLGSTASLDLPYKAEVVSDTQLKVSLFPIDEQDCGHSSNRIAYDVVYYYLPIYATAGSDNVSISVDSNGASFPLGFSGYIAQVDGKTLNIDNVGNGISTNRIVTVNAGDSIDNVTLKITPGYGINVGDSIFVNLENGSFDAAKYEQNPYTSGIDKTYEQMMDEYNKGLRIVTVLRSNLGSTCRLDLPYTAEVVSDTQLKVTLFPIDEQDCGRSLNRVANDIVSYQIPIYATAGNDNVVLSVDDNGVAVAVGFRKTIARVNGSNAGVVNGTIGGETKVVIKQDKVSEGQLESVLMLDPNNGILTGDYIVLSLENGTFADEQASYVSGSGLTYEQMMAEYDAGTRLASVLNANLGNTGRLDLPYKLERLSDTQLKVTLFPIDGQDCYESNRAAYGKPYYYIPLSVTAVEDADVYLDIDFGEAPISGTDSFKIGEGASTATGNVSYTYSNGVLTIGGTGTVGNDAASNWSEYVGSINTVVIGDGIKRIGENAFKDIAASANIYNCSNATVVASAKVKSVEYQYGDVNCDGIVAADDAAAVLQKVLDNNQKLNIEKVSENYMHYADVSNDGIFAADDASQILQKVLNFNGYKFTVESVG
jgi:hypothetical protein